MPGWRRRKRVGGCGSWRPARQRIMVRPMQLEDHAGDIVRKARSRAEVSLVAAAQAAGVSEELFAQFEDNGAWPTTANLSAVAKLVQLDDAKLAAIVAGWVPAVTDLTRWPELRVITTGRRSFTVNAFLIWDVETRAAALFDTGFDAAPILAEVAQHHLQLRALAITHGHPDHVACLKVLARQFPAATIWAPPAVHPGSKPLAPGEAFALGSLTISARATPGHADDGVTYVINGWLGGAPAVAVVGDTLFAGSVGKPEESWPLALGKVREEILSLPGETLLCPGHGPLTTVAEERMHNPFF